MLPRRRARDRTRSCALRSGCSQRDSRRAAAAAAWPSGASTAPVTCLRPLASITVCPVSTSTPAARSVSASGPGWGRRSATARICTPSSRRAIAACSPRSEVVASTARCPGSTEYRLASRRAPPASITPGRSLPANTSGCSIVPVANTCWRARTWCRVSPCHTGTSPSKYPSAEAPLRISTPAARAARPGRPHERAGHRRAAPRPPGAVPSSTSTTSAPSSAAAAGRAQPGGYRRRPPARRRDDGGTPYATRGRPGARAACRARRRFAAPSRTAATAAAA